jgi:hypothetical protein
VVIHERAGCSGRETDADAPSHLPIHRKLAGVRSADGLVTERIDRQQNLAALVFMAYAGHPMV